MTKGYERTGGVFRVWDDSRNAMVSTGALVGFLPSEESYSFTASFPDVPKGRIDLWSWSCNYVSLGSTYKWGCTGIAAVGARPQNYSSTITIGAAPSGTNLFLGRARIIRTSGPSHSWLGQTISAPPFNNVWVPVGGAMDLEGAVGFTRGLAIFISGGNLVCRIDQSVSGQCGGYRSWGNSGPVTVSNSAGGQNRYGGTGTVAQPVWFPTTSPGRKTYEDESTTLIGPGSPTITRNKWDGSDPPAYSDPTDYSSTYSVELVGRFGRHA